MQRHLKQNLSDLGELPTLNMSWYNNHLHANCSHCPCFLIPIRLSCVTHHFMHLKYINSD